MSAPRGQSAGGVRRLAAVLAACVTLAAGSGRDASATEPDPTLHAPFKLDNGLYLPYPLDNLFRGWTECTGRGHHKALDIGGVGPDAGLGSPVRAIGPAKIIQIGLPADDPKRFGIPVTEPETVVRGKMELPATKAVQGYGEVRFFTKNYGRHRSGGVIGIRLLGGRYKGYTVRYLHVAAVRPDLAVGDRVDGGEELGLIGGTAVQHDAPHLHLSMENPRGRARDVGRILGIGSTRVPCRASSERRSAIRAGYSKKARGLMNELREELRHRLAVGEPAIRCGAESIEGDFGEGKFRLMTFVLRPHPEHPLAPFTVKLERIDERERWTPRIQLAGASGERLFTGTQTAPRARRRFAIRSLQSGRRGSAEVEVTPKKVEPLTLEVMAWPAKRRSYRGAQWRLTIDRRCPTEAARPE